MTSPFDAAWSGGALGDLFAEFADVERFTFVPMRKVGENGAAAADPDRAGSTFAGVVDREAAALRQSEGYDPKSDNRLRLSSIKFALAVRDAEIGGPVRIGDRITRGAEAWTVADLGDGAPGETILYLAAAKRVA